MFNTYINHAIVFIFRVKKISCYFLSFGLFLTKRMSSVDNFVFIFFFPGEHVSFQFKEAYMGFTLLKTRDCINKFLRERKKEYLTFLAEIIAIA